MASLTEHAEAIRAALEAAFTDGYFVEIDTNVARSRHGYPAVALDLVEYEDGQNCFSVIDWEEIIHESREEY